MLIRNFLKYQVAAMLLASALLPFTTACGGGSGGGSTTATPQAPAPTISTFNATPTSPLVYQQVQLNWVVTSQAPTSLKLSLTPSTLTNLQPTGSATVTPTEASTTYTLTAEDSNGKTTKTVTVNAVGISLALPSNHMLYDATRDRIVVSVPSTGGAQGNTITLVNPTTGAIDQSVYVGSEPSQMALGDDGSTLWVGLEGAAAVRKVDLASRQALLQFSLGSHAFNGAMSVDTLTTLPGEPNTLVVALKYKLVSPRHAGVGVFDSGVKRPVTTPGHTGSNVVVSGESSSMVYGFNNETTEFGARQITIDASGATETLVKRSASSGFTTGMVFSAGRLYFTNGDVLLASDLSKIGTYALPGSSYDVTGVYVDGPGNTVYFCGKSGLIRTFVLNTFVPKASFTLNNSMHLTRIMKAGTNLVFSTATHLVIVPISALN